MTSMKHIPKDDTGRLVLSEAEIRRFWHYVNVVDDSDACWEWMGARNPHNYGTVRIAGHMEIAHRVSYAFCVGTIPPDLGVLHSCSNRPCCNPSHLRIGTHQENMQDASRSGRAHGRSWRFANTSRPSDYIPIPRLDSEERFWGKVKRGASDDCWLWQGARDGVPGNQYGKFSYGGNKHGKAHRFSYELHHGPITPGLHILHSCNNGLCVNPAHLRPCTPSENGKQCWDEGRHPPIAIPRYRRARGDASGSRKHPDRVPKGDGHWTRLRPANLARGASNGMNTHPEKRLYGDANHASKLTTEQKEVIRRRRKAGEQCKALAEEFGVSAVRVSQLGLDR